MSRPISVIRIFIFIFVWSMAQHSAATRCMRSCPDSSEAAAVSARFRPRRAAMRATGYGLRDVFAAAICACNVVAQSRSAGESEFNAHCNTRSAYSGSRPSRAVSICQPCPAISHLKSTSASSDSAISKLSGGVVLDSGSCSVCCGGSVTATRFPLASTRQQGGGRRSPAEPSGSARL